MTLLNTITLPGAYIAAIDTARRADAETTEKAVTKKPRTILDLPLWSAWGSRTA
jgi:hypothetical protein